jgi:putative ABC transport system permease protein
MRYLLLLFSEGMVALAANKFRAFLTMLGIIIGVGAIVAVVSIGDSGKRRVLNEIEKVAQPTMMWFFPDWVFIQQLRQENKPVEFLEYEQFLKVAEKTRSYGTVMAQITDGKRIRYEDKELRGRLKGVNSDFFMAQQLELEEGRWFRPQDSHDHATVCILGSEVAYQLFGDESPLGKVIRADRDRYTVIGLLKSKGMSFFSWRNYDDDVYVPMATMVHRNPSHETIMWFMAMAKDVETIPAFRLRVHEALVEVGMPAKMMKSNTFQEESQGFENVSLVLKILVAGVSAISLFVGGLGIMNIMLVTVKERTREIGLRKALGASNSSIRFQFFTESMLMGLIGGAIGAVLGVGITYGVTGFVQFPTVISTPAIFSGMIFSGLVGIVFGIYPAHQAANLDPAEALRYE